MRYLGQGWLKSVVLAGLVVVLAVVSLASSSSDVNAQTQPVSPLQRTITVVGEGKVSIRPDIARATIGVEVLNASVQEASAQNREVLDAVLEALREQGIDDADIQTSGFSVYSERFGPEGPLEEGDVRYRVSNNVNVKIRDLDTVGQVLDAAIEAGANNIYGVEFALDDVSEAQTQAREQAIADASERAAEISEFAGVTLGPVVSLSEIIGTSFYTGLESRAYGLGGGGGTPVSPGELEIVYQIQAVYSIGE